MYINSPGGGVTAGLAVYDTMQFVRPPVWTLCIGQAASMGSLLLAAGRKDLRLALPNARIMAHQSFQPLNDSADVLMGAIADEHVHMIGCNLSGDDFQLVLRRNLPQKIANSVATCPVSTRLRYFGQNATSSTLRFA